MTKKYTRIAAVAAVAAGAVALTACGGGGPSSEASGEVEGGIGYGFWGTPARAEKADAVIELFQSEYPDASVEGEVADYYAYIERLTVRAAGGDLPCATGSQSTFFAQYADNGVLRSLDDLIESGQIDVSGIPDDVLAAGQIDGEQFMIPTGTFVRLLAYNADMVATAGVDAPTNDMTWEEYADWLADVQATLPAGVYAAENEGGLMFTFSSWVIGHGGEVFTEDNELGFDKEMLADYFQYWLDLNDAGVILPPSSIPEQNGALELTPMAVGTAVAGTRDIPHIYITEQALAGAGKPASIEQVSIPSEDADQSANILGSNGISIPEACDNVPTAAAWIDFFANDVDAALAFQSDNGILTNTDAQDALLDDAETPEGVKQNVTILRELTESGDLTTSRYPAGLNTISNELLRLYQSVAFGEMTVDAAVDAFFTSAEDALN
ncbi:MULTISPECIES: extracellular solute-binding protein [Microbacterium]|uniref:ABC transporter substrate-binding protein n=1 Tax=Microbacterium TaxID=33882 RepID=UPI000D6599EC|nr:MULTISPECIES: extracellular solute-binding protein [Microbacterium]